MHKLANLIFSETFLEYRDARLWGVQKPSLRNGRGLILFIYENRAVIQLDSGMYAIGRKMAGSILATLILRGLSSSILIPIPTSITPPTALISATTAALRKGARTPASNVSAPWNTSTNRAANGTPMPMAAANIILDTKSNALFAYMILLFPLIPASNDPIIVIEPTQNTMQAVTKPSVKRFSLFFPLRSFLLIKFAQMPFIWMEKV